MSTVTVDQPDAPKNYTLGQRIAPVRLFSVYRTLYPVFENGTLIAFLGMRGRRWRLLPLLIGTVYEGAAPRDAGGIALGVHGAIAKVAPFAFERLATPIVRERFHTLPEVVGARKAERASAVRHRSGALATAIETCARKAEQRDALIEVLEKILPTTRHETTRGLRQTLEGLKEDLDEAVEGYDKIVEAARESLAQAKKDAET